MTNGCESLEEFRDVHRAARVAHISWNAKARYHAEGFCAVCGLIVPVCVMPKSMATASHWPDDPTHSYGSVPSYFCRGSNAEPSGLLESEAVTRVAVSADTMALLMDGAADELEGRVTTVAIAWDDELSREEVHRLSRAWAGSIGQKPVVAATRIRIYGDRGEHTS